METTTIQKESTLSQFTRIHDPKPSKCTKKADDFLNKTGTTIMVKYLKHDKHFASDNQKRDIYAVTIQRGARKFSFEFGASIIDSGIVHAWGDKLAGKEFRHKGLNCVSSQVIADGGFSRYELGEFQLIEKRTKPPLLQCTGRPSEVRPRIF